MKAEAEPVEVAVDNSIVVVEERAGISVAVAVEVEAGYIERFEVETEEGIVSLTAAAAAPVVGAVAGNSVEAVRSPAGAADSPAVVTGWSTSEKSEDAVGVAER